MKPREQLLAAIEATRTKPLEPRGYQPPFEGPIIGFNTTGFGSEAQFAESLARKDDDCDVKEPWQLWKPDSYYEGFNEALEVGWRTGHRDGFAEGFGAASFLWVLVVLAVVAWGW